MEKLTIKTLNADTLSLAIHGDWDKTTLSHFKSIERSLLPLKDKTILFDFSGCSTLDSAGAIAIIRLKHALIHHHCTPRYTHLAEKEERLLALYEKNFHEKPPLLLPPYRPIERLGRWVEAKITGIGNFLAFVGEMIIAMVQLLFSPWNFRFTTLVNHIDTSVLRAIPIVMILSFLIGIVIAYQSAQYLVHIGGDIFIVDVSVMSIFRELSPMISAILIAARSASSYTAEIGTMKMTDELDAMRTMGFDPFVFLVIPRVFALIFMMPVVIFAADMAGMVGALLVANFHLGISVPEFLDRMYLEVSINEWYVGLGKSPIYGAIIAIVGCYWGFQVAGSTQSIGTFTTKSVVSAIFWVIICDAIIAIALTKLGL
ncbi:MAG: ABC transporter permease [Sulfuricurvum sp.]